MPTNTAKQKKTDRPPTHRDDPLISIRQVAEQIGRDKITVAKWVTSGLVKGYRDPSGIRVRLSEVNKFLAGTADFGNVKVEDK